MPVRPLYQFLPSFSLLSMCHSFILKLRFFSMSVSLLIISPPSVSLVHSQVRILFSKSVTLLILSPPSVSFVHSQVRILFSMSVSFLILSLFLLCHSFILTLGFFSFSFHSLSLSLILVLYRSVFSS